MFDVDAPPSSPLPEVYNFRGYKYFWAQRLLTGKVTHDEQITI